MFNHGNNDLSSSNRGLQSYNVGNETDDYTSEFIDSILKQPDELFYEVPSFQNNSSFPSESLFRGSFIKEFIWLLKYGINEFRGIVICFISNIMRLQPSVTAAQIVVAMIKHGGRSHCFLDLLMDWWKKFVI
jgi:hypothetical protein